MSINRDLKSALEAVAPVEADTYEGKKAVYITINYNTVPVDFGDDEADHERVLYQVHLFAPTGYDTIKQRRAIKRALAALGSTWPTMENASDKQGQHLIFEGELAIRAGAE